jgi:GT2 family glycosyltransferase
VGKSIVSQNELSSTKFSIALVNYKTLDLTRVCLNLLKSHMDSGRLDASRVDVWVVDNDSKDESTAYLRGLDWINLIERPSPGKEQGFAAHGEGLDLILSAIKTDYLFLMHTDTFIYEPAIFDICLQRMRKSPAIAAVGCLHQLNRGAFRFAWRTVTGFIKFHSRRAKLALGMPSRQPKPYIEPYIKSFFALWDVKRMKQLGYRFYMEQKIPGYALQDKLTAQGFLIEHMGAPKLFRYLDHVEAGTVGLVSGYNAENRRLQRKHALLDKLQNQLKEET